MKKDKRFLVLDDKQFHLPVFIYISLKNYNNVH